MNTSNINFNRNFRLIFLLCFVGKILELTLLRVSENCIGPNS